MFYGRFFQAATARVLHPDRGVHLAALDHHRWASGGLPGHRSATVFLFGRTFNARTCIWRFYPDRNRLFADCDGGSVWSRLVWLGVSADCLLEGVFRRIERLYRRPGEQAASARERSMESGKILRKAALHICYVVIAYVLAHLFWRTLCRPNSSCG